MTAFPTLKPSAAGVQEASHLGLGMDDATGQLSFYLCDEGERVFAVAVIPMEMAEAYAVDILKQAAEFRARLQHGAEVGHA